MIDSIEKRRQSQKQIDHKKVDLHLRASELQYRRLFETAQDGILILNGKTGKIEDVNPFLLTMLGYSRDEIIGKLLWQIGAFKDVKRSKEAFSRLQRDDFIRFDNMPLETKTGKPYAVEFVSNAYLVDHRRVIQCNIRDITEREKLKDNLQLMATHDSLTGLPNRALLFDRFTIALANSQREKKRLSIMSLDLDKFKAINDTFGHAVGDQVLVAAAGRLTNILRKVDTVARIGGDEFILLLWEVDQKEAAIKIAQKIVKSFRRPLMKTKHKITMTVSIGVAIYPEDGKDIEELLKKSDKLMYQVKVGGRNNYRLSAGKPTHK
ncbi:MAG: sensor domain-containing diguanylate cyclase [Dehalococcoidia bacterium]|nr:sensor domain-containing diguanylate cyclase [Dehalococcoidia bacterium]